VLSSALVVMMSMLDKDKVKEFADRIADINQQVQTDDVNFEQPVDTQWTVTVVGVAREPNFMDHPWDTARQLDTT
jgi:hypothetical protein